MLLERLLRLAAVVACTAVDVSDVSMDPPFFHSVSNTCKSIVSGVSIHARPSVLERSGNWVSVEWSAVTSPSGSDWIGLFDADANYSVDAPIKYKMVEAGFTTDNHPPLGSSGYAEFRLINVRKALRFAYMRGGFVKPTVVAESDPITFVDLNAPSQVHLTLTGRSDEMRVNFVTTDTCSAPQVKWALCDAEASTEIMTNASSYTYGSDALCGAPANTVGWRDPGILATGVLKPLAPSTCYRYVVHCGNSTSAAFRFQSPPLLGDKRPFSFAALADLGQSEIDGSYTLAGKSQAAHETVSQIAAASGVQVPDGSAMFDFVLLAGDISYARGHAYQWDNFGSEIEHIAARVPWMVGLGNHERDYPESGSSFSGVGGSGCNGECGVPAELRYPMPGAILPSNGARAAASAGGLPTEPWRWYSFDHASVHVVMISTEHDLRQNSSQFKWLAKDLRAVNRTNTPWIVLAGHRPMYVSTCDKDDWNVSHALQNELEDLLVESGVDLAIWGHTHNAQRTCKLRRGVCVDTHSVSGVVHASGSGGIVHIVAGHAGYHTSLCPHDPRPHWLEWISLGTHGFCRVHVISEQRMMLECLDNANGEVVDSVMLSKEQPSLVV